MKYRLFALVLLLSLALAACSLAEDITPPPGYTQPAALPTIVASTATPIPSLPATSISTSAEVVATSNSATPATPIANGSTTPEAGTSPTPQPSFVGITGTVTGLFGAVLPIDTVATLEVYNITNSQVTQTFTAPIKPDGTYSFTEIPADKSTAYWVDVDYNGITYESIPAQFDGSAFQFDLPITIYNSTEDLSALTISQAHLQFDFSTSGQVQIALVYVITNPGTNSVIFPSTGNDIPFIQIPATATNIQYQLDQSSSPLVVAAKGYAFLPGSDKQYVVISTFTLPYTGSLVYSQPFTPPVTSATVIVPEGIRISSDQLTDGGTQASTGTSSSTFHLYQAGSLATGSTLTMTISGNPGDKGTGVNLDQRSWIMIGVGALGLVLVGVGIFLFLRDRKLRTQEDVSEAGGEAAKDDKDALGENIDSIMDAIIVLDDQYKAGDLSKEAYEQRRNELKDRLKNLS